MSQALGNILTSIVSNSHFGKRPGARDVTVFGYHVGPHIPNIGYLEKWEGMYRCMRAYGGMWRYLDVCGGIWKYYRTEKTYRINLKTGFNASGLGPRIT